ncbi:4'-phosphopantetheinyl transferase family protein [Hydromonas duriensis]|nr:4'-phosphopantetheinyl transferase superfamily protein [Hydromonas duriensis]
MALMPLSKMDDIHFLPRSFLSRTEELEFQTKTTSKTRKNYLAGRFVGQYLLNKHSPNNFHQSIINNNAGAPEIWSNQTKVNTTISLSHSNDWVAAIINSNGQPVGIDIEKFKVRASMFEMALFLAHEQERDWVTQNGQNAMWFYQYWTAKEALAKAYQKPLTSMKDYSFFSQLNVAKSESQRWVDNNGTHVQHFKLPCTSYIGAWAIQHG